MNDHDIEMLNDLQAGQEASACCDAGTYGEMMICEDCGEHCG